MRPLKEETRIKRDSAFCGPSGFTPRVLLESSAVTLTNAGKKSHPASPRKRLNRNSEPSKDEDDQNDGDNRPHDPAHRLWDRRRTSEFRHQPDHEIHASRDYDERDQPAEKAAGAHLDERMKDCQEGAHIEESHGSAGLRVKRGQCWT